MAGPNYPLQAINHVDELLKEYLLFRGFTQTIRVLDSEKKNDKLKGYQVPQPPRKDIFLIVLVLQNITAYYL